MSNFGKKTSTRRSTTVSLRPQLVVTYLVLLTHYVCQDQQVMQAFQNAMQLLNQS